MNENDPPRDKLGPLPPENFSNDFPPDKPPRSKADLTPYQRRVLGNVLADNPELTEAEALAELEAHGF